MKGRRLLLIAILVLVLSGILLLLNIESTQRGGGLLLPDIASIQEVPFDTVGSSFAYDFADFDLEATFPPAGDQLEQGSCTAFAVAYYLMSSYEKRIGGYDYGIDAGTPDYGRVFSPSFLYNGARNPSASCGEGIPFLEAFEFISRNGGCKWNDFKYSGNPNDCSIPPNQDHYDKAKAFLGYRFYRVKIDKHSFKKKIDQGIPIILGIMINHNFYKDGMNSKQFPYIWNPEPYDIVDYHAIVCVGYSDQLHAFKLLNSYGPDWGNSGYCFVPYEALVDRVREAYIARIDRNLRGLQEFVPESLLLEGAADSIPIESLRHEEDLDSLFRNDLELLRSLPNINSGQEELIKQLEMRLKP